MAASNQTRELTPELMFQLCFRYMYYVPINALSNINSANGLCWMNYACILFCFMIQKRWYLEPFTYSIVALTFATKSSRPCFSALTCISTEMVNACASISTWIAVSFIDIYTAVYVCIPSHTLTGYTSSWYLMTNTVSWARWCRTFSKLCSVNNIILSRATVPLILPNHHLHQRYYGFLG